MTDFPRGEVTNGRRRRTGVDGGVRVELPRGVSCPVALAGRRSNQDLSGACEGTPPYPTARGTRSPRKTVRRLTVAEVDALVEGRLAGEEIHALAARFAIGRTTV